MKASLNPEFRYLAQAWLSSALAPLPALVFWQSEAGLRMALWLFFVGAVSLVTYSFARHVNAVTDIEREDRQGLWRTRILSVTAALLFNWALFTAIHLTVNDSRDYVSVLLALSGLIPACCVSPYFTLVTRKPFAAVVFTLAVVGCMKLLGCIVVVLVHGWDASERGYTTMPWTHPNLLVWLFWLNTSVLSLVCYCRGFRRFCGGTTYAVRQAGGNC